MQLKYSFKKEWAHFTRTFRIWGIIIAIVSFALSNPLMFKFTAVVMEQLADAEVPSFAAITEQTPNSSVSGAEDGILGGMGFDDISAMYSDAGLMFSITIVSFCGSGILIIMLLLMSAAGGEQKKRAMIVPNCSGLKAKNYLLPKFIIYPLASFAITFLCSLLAGVLCNALFPANTVSADTMLLMSLFCGIYMIFIICVYISLGICTSHPGIMTAAVYVGQTFLQTLLNSMNITGYNPFTLLNLISGEMTTEGFDLAAEAPSIIVAILLSLAISVIMYFLALGVTSAKRIDNTQEEKPEF